MVASDAVRIAVIGADIPTRHGIAPLKPRPIVETVGGRREVVAIRAKEDAEGQGSVESRPVIQEAYADETVPLDVVGLDPRAQVNVIRHEAACANREVVAVVR